jgi:hypothetical protein
VQLTCVEAKFSSANFVKEAYFSRVTFTEKADFFETIFTEKADFSSATFTTEAKFSSATFTTEADFFQTIFTTEADFSLATFTERADFSLATFTEKANFFDTSFQGNANFSQASFLNEVRFSGSVFKDETLFRYTIFEQPNKVLFDVDDLSKVSFAGCDISKTTFTDKVKWGGKDHLKVIEEEWIETGRKKISLDLVLYVYRRLRENYEFNLKFDEAGKFFIKEMELKRNFREVRTAKKIKGSKDVPKIEISIRKNHPLRRHLFSLTALYHLFSNYGESIWRPTVIGIGIVVLSTLFWIFQNYPTAEPSLSLTASEPQMTKTVHNFINVTQILNDTHTTAFSFVVNSKPHIAKTFSNFINVTQILNITHTLKAFERSLGDFLPVLSLPSDIKIG